MIRLNLTLCILYALLLVCLGVRRFIPPAYEALYGTDIGTWAMYRSRIDSRTEAFLTTPTGPIDFDATRYLWHGSIMTSAHPHLTQPVLDRFVAWLAGNAAVREIAPGSSKVTVRVVHRVNNGPEQVMQAESPVTP